MWYAYGGIVLDRLLGVARTREVHVSMDGVEVAPAEIRQALGLSRGQLISIEVRPIRTVCNLDEIHLAGSNQLVGDAIAAVKDEMRLELIDSDLRTTDIIRLSRWVTTYPELEVDPLLAQRLNADMHHLRAISKQFEDVALLLEDSETEFLGSSTRTFGHQ